MKDQFTYDNESYEVQFRGCQMNTETQQLEFLVDWKGFSESESCWELVQSLWQDVSQLVQNYHRNLKISGHELTHKVLEEIKKWTHH